MQPKISVIIPVYNAERDLNRCVDSVLSQSHQNFELLLIDDGSRDNSGEICDEYEKKDARVKVFHKNNGGVSSARNLGLQEATGKYVTFIDSDDWISQTYLEDFKIENCPENRAVLILQGIQQYYPERKSIKDIFKYNDEIIYLESNSTQLITSNILENGCPVAKIFDLDVIKQNNILFNTTISLNEDHLFFLDYLYYTKIIYTKRVINYTYVYDFTVPSLTKIKHQPQESIITASAISYSFKKLLNKYSIPIEDCSRFYHLFGPNQVIRASKDVYSQKDRFNEFSKIVQSFKPMFSERIILDNKDVYYKSYVYFINKVNIRIFFYIQFVLCMYVDFVRIMKYYIKQLLRIR